MEKKISIQVEPLGFELMTTRGETLLEACLAAKIDINHSCGGFGTCGTCRIFVLKGLADLESRNEVEMEMALDRGFKEDERLACQTIPKTGLSIRIP